MCPSERYGRREEAMAGSTKGSGPLRPAFDLLDADRDGRIGRDDLKAFYSSSAGCGNQDGDDEAIGSMITAADADRDGYVAFEEFSRAVLPGGGGVMEEVFRVMDRDGDGLLGFGDLRGYMYWARLPASDDDIRAMLRLGGAGDDGEGGGGVSLEGLVKILAGDSMGGGRD
uniref:Squidulin n=1 Tax=Anthurium amnicola TaxID=1678845 RepID=A0A1D1YFM3_9ARAE